MRALTPLTLKDSYYRAIEAEIRRMLDHLLYLPLLDIIGLRMRDINREIKNSKSLLRDAIAKGDIWYKDGQFQGRFNAKTSLEIIRLGAKYNVKSKTYSLPQDKVPLDLRLAQAAATDRYEVMRRKILDKLNEIKVDDIDAMSQAPEEYEKTLTAMEADLQKTIPKKPVRKSDNPAVSQILIEAKLTDEQKRIISVDWANNLDLYIKDWTADNILKLREQIQPHIIAGGRAEGLIKVVQDNYNVATRKAKFLARQETALLMSKFQETRYTDMGIKKYRWSGADDKRERPDHKALNGKIFSFDSPPVTDRRTGARNNPGQDYNCRCVAIPLVE